MLDFNGALGEETEKIDFELIKSQAAGCIESILNKWLPGGRLNGREYVCAGLQGGKGESCSTNITTGVGADFASDEKWGDVIELVAKAEGTNMVEAARTLQEFLGGGEVSYCPVPIIPKQSEEERRAYAMEKSTSLWMEGETCPPTHNYLLKKQINPDPGIRYHPRTGEILVPLRQGQDVLGVQRITASGEKKVNAGGMLSGCSHVIAGEHDTVYICEGYATAMTVHMATGKTAVMAVSAGNLSKVGESVAKLYPTSRLIFAADNDQGADKNPGVEAAQKAIAKIGRGQVIAPPFPEGQKGDWNDYAIEHGGASVRSLLLSHKKKRILVDAKSLELKEPEFLVEGAIETPCTGMIFGPSGSGKSFFVFDLAMHCATGRPWQGKKVKQGQVIYICGEGRHAIPRRIKAWETHHGVTLPPGVLQATSTTVDFEPDSVLDLMAEIDELARDCGRPPVAIFIDTMARALPGQADENSTKDVGLFIRECDRLQDQYSCSVIIVHHTGHNENKRARGSSSLKGAMDVEILVDKRSRAQGCKQGLIEWTKTKDIEAHKTIGFTIQKVEYGSGKHDNSCILDYDIDYQPGKKDVSPNMKAALTSLDEAIRDDGISETRCMLGTWRNLYRNFLEGVTDRQKNKSFKEQWERLQDEGKITVTGNIVEVNIDRDEQVTNGIFRDLF